MSALRLQVYTSPTRAIRGAGERTFSPVTSTLITGERDAVLVDAGFIREDVDALGDMIAAAGKRLTTIFVTHGHSDHYFGGGRLAERFPGVRMVAAPGVVEYVRAHRDADVQLLEAMFGDTFTPPTLLPEPLDSDLIDLEGHELRVIDVGQGDIAPSTVLHVPELGAVMVGDIAYHGIHQMLGMSGPADWDAWIRSVDTIERLKPRTVVVGHKKPELSDDDVPAILEGTRDYIRDFAEAAARASSARDIVGAMTARYPDRGNLTTLLFSAGAAARAKAS